MNRRAMRWLGAVTLVLGGTVLQARLYSRVTHEPALSELARAPVVSLSGESFVLPKRGKLVLVFWASWCRPCEDELRVFSRSTPSNAWYALNVTDSPAAVQEYMERTGVLRESVLLGPESLLDRYRIAAFPTLFLIQDGSVVETIVGGGAKTQAKVKEFLG